MKPFIYIPLLLAAIIAICTAQMGSINGAATYTTAAAALPPMPFYYGGTGRYMYILIVNGYTTAVPTQQYVSIIDTDASDAVIDTINLSLSKNFSSIFYRAVDSTVHVVGTNWETVIDAGEGRGTLHTKLASRAWSMASASGQIGSYLPYPLDFFSSGGSQAKLPGASSDVPIYTSPDGRYTGNNIRMGGHSNTPNMIYYHVSQTIAVNRSNIHVTNTPSPLMANVSYSMEADPQFGYYGDLQTIVAPVYRFMNFYVVSTGNTVYLLNDKINSNILWTMTPAMGATDRTYQAYCPNARDKLFFTSQTTQNIISVVELDSINKRLNNLGDINRAAYKDTNEAGCGGLMYNPRSGRLYALGHNNINTTGVSKLHVYDPTQSSLASMYVRTVTVGELMGESRASITALNQMCMNRTPIYEYPGKGM